MKNLRKLSLVIILTFALALSAFAETPTALCADPAPGQTETPPCATRLVSGDVKTPAALSIAPGNTGTPRVAHQTLLTRFAVDLLLDCLPLF
jgi:hypothetical protein